jgi:P2 family phage contractile tail tube protein
MPVYPATVKNFSVYGPQGVEIGVADITLPNLQFEKDALKGSMLAGSANIATQGNLQAMETTINFHTNSKQSLGMFAGGRQRIRALASIYAIDTSSGEIDDIPEEIIMGALASGYNQGRRETSTKGGVAQLWDIIYLAVVFQGQKFWEIDFFNNICIINGHDLNAKTRANL